MSEPIRFFLLETNGGVGTFVGDVPRAPGEYPYMPFRSVSHYKLGQKLRAGENVRCYYEQNGHRVIFEVAAIPSYGRLHVTEVDDGK